MITNNRQRKNIFMHYQTINHSDIVIFTRHLSTLISAGIPLIPALHSIAQSQHKSSMKMLLLSLKSAVLEGNSFSDSLSKYPKVFDNLFCQLIRSAEQSGTLDSMLKQLAQSLEQSASLKKKIKKSLSYPAAILAFSLFVSLFLFLFVVPEFESLFSSFGAKLPALTRFLINISTFLRDQGWLLILILIIISFILKWTLKYLISLKEIIDKFAFRLIFIGPILEKTLLIKLSQTLAILLKAGTPLVEVLNLITKIINKTPYQQALIKISHQVSCGQSLHNALNNAALFPPLFTQLIGAGENAGSLPQILDKIVSYYEEDLDQSISDLHQLLEPVIMLTLGMIVGGFVIAIYLPLFKLGSVF